MANEHQIRELLNATAYDVNGDKLGSVEDVYINEASKQPDFIKVSHGLFGMSSSLVPLRGHSFDGEKVTLAFAKDLVKDAPQISEDALLEPEDQKELYSYYGLTNVESKTSYFDEDAQGSEVEDRQALVDEHQTERKDAHVAQDTASADNELILSEERLSADTQREAVGKAHLRKYVVHETRTIDVPVSREEVRIERTPISEDEAAQLGEHTIAEDNASVTLYADKVNVSKTSVPVEKVSLGKETVEETRQVSADVAHEELDTEGVVVDEDHK